jgi:hypothetical protein
MCSKLREEIASLNPKYSGIVDIIRRLNSERFPLVKYERDPTENLM